MLSTYHAELRLCDGKKIEVLIAVFYRYASEDSERIAVFHVIRHAVPGRRCRASSTAVHLSALRGSIKLLQKRLRPIVSFLDTTRAGERWYAVIGLIQCRLGQRWNESGGSGIPIFCAGSCKIPYSNAPINGPCRGVRQQQPRAGL